MKVEILALANAGASLGFWDLDFSYVMTFGDGSWSFGIARTWFSLNFYNPTSLWVLSYHNLNLGFRDTIFTLQADKVELLTFLNNLELFNIILIKYKFLKQ
jgi:hypothetical protein